MFEILIFYYLYKTAKKTNVFFFIYEIYYCNLYNKYIYLLIGEEGGV